MVHQMPIGLIDECGTPRRDAALVHMSVLTRTFMSLYTNSVLPSLVCTWHTNSKLRLTAANEVQTTELYLRPICSWYTRVFYPWLVCTWDTNDKQRLSAADVV